MDTIDNIVKKRILFICSPYFGYYKHIINEFELQGFVVDYYNDRPSENSFVKGMIKIKRNFMDHLIEKYFESILNETRNKKYDLVFIMNGKAFTDKMIKRLKLNQQSAKFVFYSWDTLSLYPHVKELASVFDKVFSFDSRDCENIEKLEFLPLFYTKPYEEIGIISADDELLKTEYDIMSVCTAHPNRYKTMHNLFPELESKGIKIFSYMFLNKLQYLYNKVFEPEFNRAKRSEFEFVPLSELENIAVLKKSNTVFDMQHDQQSGLTMRTIETLGANRKLITTNKNIKKYDFYNENNILVMEDHNLTAIAEFIKHDYKPINNDIYKKYSLHSWIKTIVNEGNNSFLNKACFRD